MKNLINKNTDELISLLDKLEESYKEQLSNVRSLRFNAFLWQITDPMGIDRESIDRLISSGMENGETYVVSVRCVVEEKTVIRDCAFKKYKGVFEDDFMTKLWVVTGVRLKGGELKSFGERLLIVHTEGTRITIGELAKYGKVHMLEVKDEK